MNKTNGAVQIYENIYWVGKSEHEGMLHCNPYLIVDGDEAVLIDPGSPLDFDVVLKNVTDLIPLENIKYVVLHHQDPDLCAAVPLFENAGAKFQVVTHRWTQSLVKYYGLKSEYYILNDHQNKLTLKSGREIYFLETPYLHFSGSVVTYDPISRILFTSDLFGAYSRKWSLYADDDYIEKMKDFNEHYMPSHETLKPAMEIFEKMDIAMLAPQHGSIIKENIAKYIKALKDLECGIYLTDYKRRQAQNEGFLTIINEIIHRYSALYGSEEVYGILEKLNVKVALDAMAIVGHNYKENGLWNAFFDEVYAQKGIEWISVLESLVRKYVSDYGVPMPNIYEQAIMKIEIQAASYINEVSKLQMENNYLSSAIRETEEKLLRCPVTGLYNANYFKSYTSTQIHHACNRGEHDEYTMIMISLDNLTKIKYLYGDNEVDEILRNSAYLLQEMQVDRSMLFRLQGATFAINLTGYDKAAAIQTAERIRNRFADFEGFIEPITVSIGVVSMDEICKNGEVQSPEKQILEVALMRVGLAKRIGMNIVCSESDTDTLDTRSGKVLLVDTDSVNTDFLKNQLEENNFHVLVARDGLSAFEIVQHEKIDLIISDVMLPKIDGFFLREKLLEDSATKNIVYILLSHLKNEDSVKRAIGLEIEHYFKKPYMISEIIGIAKNRMKSVSL